jgi:hypothetical protein
VFSAGGISLAIKVDIIAFFLRLGLVSFLATGKMPVPQRVNFVVGWALLMGGLEAHPTSKK